METGFAENYRNRRLVNYTRLQRWMEGHETVAKFAAALVLAFLTGALAQINIYTPLTPVPFTMQVFGVALMGGLLGRRWGTISALFYVGLGVLGLPMFAGDVANGTWGEFLRLGVFTSSLSAWYLVGFVLQAHIVGMMVESRSDRRNAKLLAFASIAVAGLVLFALLDVYFLSDYGALYRTSAFPNVWFALLSLGVVLVVASCAWLGFTTKARRERIELFFGNIVGLLALYAVGAAGFYLVWQLLGFGALSASTLLAFAILPFIPVDLAKILLAVAVLTLVRPTQRELAPKPTETIV